jgi:hypothetical protein
MRFYRSLLDGNEPDETPADENSESEPVMEIASALDHLQLDDPDLVENVRQDLQLDAYETLPITESQRRVVEAESSRAMHVRLCTDDCPSASTPSTWALTLSEKISTLQTSPR